MSGFKLFIRDREYGEVAPATIKFYTERFDTFFTFLHEQKNTTPYDLQGAVIDIPCLQITKDNIFEFTDYLRNRNQSIRATSINNYLVAIRTILNFLYKEDYMPKIEVKLKKVVTKIKKNYAMEDIYKLIDIPEKEKKENFTTYRNWVIINYLFATGNRPETVRNIKIEDVDFRQDTITFKITKNKRQYIIPLEVHLKKILQDYLIVRGGLPSDYFFCNQFGGQLTYTAIYQSIRKYNLKHGIEQTTLKGFRHSFAKEYIRETGNIEKLKQFMGHEDIKSTQVYADLFGEHLRERNNTNNPLEKLYINTTKTNKRINEKMI